MQQLLCFLASSRCYYAIDTAKSTGGFFFRNTSLLRLDLLAVHVQHAERALDQLFFALTTMSTPPRYYYWSLLAKVDHTPVHAVVLRDVHGRVAVHLLPRDVRDEGLHEATSSQLIQSFVSVLPPLSHRVVLLRLQGLELVLHLME